MRTLNDFNCPSCGMISEHLAETGTRHVKCPNCGGEATLILAAPRIKLDGTDPAFPTAWDRWATVHEKEAARARKREDYGGTYHGDN